VACGVLSAASMRHPLLFAALTAATVGACATTGEVILTPTGNDPIDGGGHGGEGGSAGAGGSGGAPVQCVDGNAVYEATPAKSNVLFLVDRSGSMHLSIDAVDTRWTATKNGLFHLLDALPSTLSAGLSLFPSGDQPVTCCKIIENVIQCAAYCAPGELPGPEARCDPSAYQSPALAFAELDAGHKQAMKDLVSTVDDEFYWGTPLAPALDGAIASVAGIPDGVSAVILLTDGNPTSCDTPADPGANDIQRVVDAAAGGYASATPVRTFVMGVIDGTAGANAANLSLVASAGGTGRYAGCEAAGDCAYPINVATFEADFQAALDAIALEAFDCTFDVPAVEDGVPDYSALTLTLTDDAGTVGIPKDQLHENGWDYLPNQKQIQLYGDACAAAKADGASVQVVIGCSAQ